MTFRKWLSEDCGEVTDTYQNRFPSAAKSKYVTNDTPELSKKRKKGVAPTVPPESLFGFMKK